MIRTLSRLEAKLENVTKDLRKVKSTGEASGKGIGKEMEAAGGKMKKAGAAAQAAFGPKALTQMKSFAVGVAGIGGAAGGVLAMLRLVTAEIRSVQQLQASAAQTQITVSAARQELIRNLGGLSIKQIREVIASGVEISRETNVSQTVINRALAQGVSASGGDKAGAVSSVRLAAKFLADSPESIAPFAGSLLDLAKVTGSRDTRLNLGFTQFAGQQSRVVNPILQAKNIPPALIGARSFGTTAAGGAALFAALSNAAADVTGAVTGTGLINLSKQLEKVLPQFGTTTERIQALQASPEEARKFLASGSFEQKVQGPIRSLLTDPNSVIARQFNKNLASIPGDRGLVRLAGRAIANRRADPLEGTASLARALDVAIEQADVSDPRRATAGVIRPRFKELLKRTGVRAIESSLLLAEFEARSRVGTRDPLGVFSDILERRAEVLTAPRKEVLGPFLGEDFGIGPGARTIPISAQERETAANLDDVVAELRTIARNTSGSPTLGQPDVDQ